MACVQPNPFSVPLHDDHDDLHDPAFAAAAAMDADLIKLVNKLQDTFANLGQ